MPKITDSEVAEVFGEELQAALVGCGVEWLPAVICDEAKESHSLGIDLEVSEHDLDLPLNFYRARYMTPAASALASILKQKHGSPIQFVRMRGAGIYEWGGICGAVTADRALSNLRGFSFQVAVEPRSRTGEALNA